METIAQEEHGEVIHEIEEEGQEDDEASSESDKAGTSEDGDGCSENFNETEAEDISYLTAKPVPVSSKNDHFNMHMNGRSKTAPRESRIRTEAHNLPGKPYTKHIPSRSETKRLMGLQSDAVNTSSYEHAQKMSEARRKETFQTQGIAAIHHVGREASPLDLGAKLSMLQAPESNTVGKVRSAEIATHTDTAAKHTLIQNQQATRMLRKAMKDKEKK